MDANLAEFDAIFKKPTQTKRIVTFSIFLFILILCFIRVPYTFVFVDSFVFDFIFGTAKYYAYAILSFYFFVKIFFNKYAKKFFSKKFLIAHCLFLLGIMFTLSSIHFIVNQTSATTFFSILQTYMNGFNKYWKEFDSYDYYFNNYISGGIIVQFFYGTIKQLLWILFIIIGICLLFAAFTIFISNRLYRKIFIPLRKRIIEKLTVSSTDNKTLSELHNEDDKKVTVDEAEIRHEVMHSNIERPSLDYLNDSTINEDSKNKVDVENSQLEIDAILHSYGINFSNSKVNIMPLFSQIIYTIEDESLVEKIFRLKNEIIKKINFDNINISSKGTKVFFDLPNRFKTSISIKKALTASKVNFVGKILLGTDIDHDTIFIDTKKYKNAIIFGKIGSGSSMLLSSMIISTLYTNKPSELECIILSASSNGKTINDMFSDLPHEIYKPSLGVDACIAMIHKILAELQYKKEKMLIVIDDFDLIIKQSIHNRELIIKLLTECKQQGSFVILSSKTVSNNSASNDILNLIDIKIILQLASETESINIINSLQAVQLFGKGDGYVLFENKNKTRFQSCYTNAQEIKAYSEIIINFYKNYKLFKNEH